MNYATFDPAINLAVGPDSKTTPSAVFAADMNGDGNIDIIGGGVLYGATSIPITSIRYGFGNGHFSDNLITFSNNNVAFAVDVNHDGSVDLGLNSGDGLTIMLSNANGTFTKVNSNILGAVQAENVNRDQNLDVIALSSTTVAIFSGNGDGTFTPDRDYDAGRLLPTAIAVGDFNGDLLSDLAIPHHWSNDLGVFYGKTDGTFDSQRIIALSSGFPYPYPTSVIATDVNNDGKIDLIVGKESDGIDLLLGSGNGNFSVGKIFGGSHPAVAASDFNLDGNVDLVFSNFDTVSVSLGNGTGSFAEPVQYATGYWGNSFAISDFNNDGKPDIAVSNRHDTNRISVLINSTIMEQKIISPKSVFIDENVATNTIIYQVKSVGLNSNHGIMYTISGGEDVSLFNVNPQTGSVTFKTAPDFESPSDHGSNNKYQISVKASDGILFATQPITIGVINVNEAPVFTSPPTVKMPANSLQNSDLYSASAVDPDFQTHLTYSISGGSDANLFKIDSQTGAVTLKSLSNDYAELKGTYKIEIEASDGFLIAEQPISIVFAEAPEIFNLNGMTYFWKPDSTGKHALFSGVTASAGPVDGANAPIQIKNIAWDATGHVTADVYAHITAGMDSLDLNLDFGTGTNAAFTSAMDSSWTLLNNSSTSSLAISAYSLTATGSGDLNLGSITFDVGSAAQAHISVNSGSDISFNNVATKSTAFTYDLAHSTTGSDGSFTISSVASGNYSLTASRGIADIGNAITSADALSALKIAVALNPNATVNGQQLAVSPFQFMAADANGDGRVTSADALSILKMAVKLPGAITPQWMFVEDTRDFYDDANGVFTLNRSNASWDHTINAIVAGDTTENLVGILKGDVNGSWSPPAGSAHVEDLSPTYFTTLANTIHTPLSEFGIFG